MHGDEMGGDEDDGPEDVDQEEADRQEEAAAYEPFEPDNWGEPGIGYEVMPCPAKVPHDIEPGTKLARWFGPPYNDWFVGKVDHVNKRRTKAENVCVHFNDKTYGETMGMFCALKEEYGANRLWCLLKGSAIELHNSSSEPPSDEDEGGEGGAGPS
jgi:hypothetical protein